MMSSREARDRADRHFQQWWTLLWTHVCLFLGISLSVKEGFLTYRDGIHFASSLRRAGNISRGMSTDLWRRLRDNMQRIRVGGLPWTVDAELAEVRRLRLIAQLRAESDADDDDDMPEEGTG